MSFLNQKFADLTGFKIGNFTVETIAGRDAAGAPLWRVACGRCSATMILSHSKATQLLESKAADNLRCVNELCPLSKRQPAHSETVVEFRRRERLESEQAAQREAETQRRAATESAKEREKQNGLAALREEWRTFWRHQIQTKIEEKKIVSFQRWTELSAATRKMLLDRIKTNPTVYFEDLG